MKPEDLDRIFARAGAEHHVEQQVEPELLRRISAAILPGLRPVRPMPSDRVIVAGLLLLTAAVGIAGASILGMYGIRKLSGFEAASIFVVVGLFAWLAASQSAAEMVPGSRRLVNPAVLVCTGILTLMAVFAALFGGNAGSYAMDGFVQQGVGCLRAGLMHALPAAGGTWLILRRGMAVNRTAAGIAAGTLAGLAGVTMLSLHCPNLRAIHVMAWHVAVVPVSAAAGALLARALTFRERSAARRS
ncbi:MAG TPA: NrsF family protein [Candidatus Acidoferrales bacterium]|jgi:hypothetical protein|nr:NrsF family protein [Candidatus Acidoferrales bacterium]